jgi:hypothetical protein
MAGIGGFVCVRYLVAGHSRRLAFAASSDPTGITLVIIIVFGISTLWCGVRSRELSRQHDLLLRRQPRRSTNFGAGRWMGVVSIGVASGLEPPRQRRAFGFVDGSTPMDRIPPLGG